MYSWREVYELSLSLLEPRGTDGQGGSEGEAGGNDEVVTQRVNSLLPVIVWDAEPTSDAR